MANLSKKFPHIESDRHLYADFLFPHQTSDRCVCEEIAKTKNVGPRKLGSALGARSTGTVPLKSSRLAVRLLFGILDVKDGSPSDEVGSSDTEKEGKECGSKDSMRRPFNMRKQDRRKQDRRKHDHRGSEQGARGKERQG